MTEVIKYNKIKAADKCRYDAVSMGEVMLRLDPRDIPTARARDNIRLSQGGGFFHWGFVIGTKDMVYSESQIQNKEKRDESWMQVQPGFYVYAQY